MDKLFDILHEDADLLVINKPAGLVCHPTKGDVYSSLISRVRLHLGGTTGAHLINRLDRETSGVVIVAKHPAAAGELGKVWESRAVEKEYLAIVHGHVPAERGLIDAPLGRDAHSRVAIKDAVRADGAAAQTEFWVERRFSRPVLCKALELSGRISSSQAGVQFSLSARPTGGEGRGEVGFPSAFSLLRVVPRTGRKHQIRIHLAHLGHPIVGDKIYGGDEDLYLALVAGRLTDGQRARLILPQHALHAAAVRFAWREQEWIFRAPPEPGFVTFAAAQ